MDDDVSGEDIARIEARIEALAARPDPTEPALAAAAMALTLTEEDAAPAGPWAALTGFRLNAPSSRTMRLYLGDRGFDAPLYSDDVPDAVLLTEDGEVVVFDAGETFVLTPRPPMKDAAHSGGGDGAIASPMPT